MAAAGVAAGGAVGWDVGASSVFIVEHPTANNAAKAIAITKILRFMGQLSVVEIRLSSTESGVF